MKAIRIHRWGGPEVLTYEDAPQPEPADGELLIRVHAAGVNPVDWKTRSGKGIAPLLGEHPFPLIPGWDVSGVVEQAAPGAHGFAPGDEVFGLVRFPEPGAAYAEYVAAPADQLAKKPASLDHQKAAALPLVALTAWQALFEAADLREGQTLLVHAAAGGVGHVAVQLAKWKGARVIGTASTRNQEYLAKLGVDVCVDYRKARFEDVAQDCDVVLDTLAGEVRLRSWSVVKPGGVLVSILGDPGGPIAEQHGARAAHVLVRPNGGQMTEIARLAAEGRLDVNLDSVFTLAEADRAHQLSREGHTRGKIVLRVVDGA